MTEIMVYYKSIGNTAQSRGMSDAEHPFTRNKYLNKLTGGI